MEYVTQIGINRFKEYINKIINNIYGRKKRLVYNNIIGEEKYEKKLYFHDRKGATPAFINKINNNKKKKILERLFNLK